MKITQLRNRIGTENGIVADVKVQFAISIHIPECAGGSPGLRRDARLPRDVFVTFAAFIVQQNATPIGGNINVRPAVVIIVPDRAAQKMPF